MRTIAATTLIFLTCALSAQAQPNLNRPAIVPDDAALPANHGAAKLQGVEARSININFNVAAPNTFELPVSNRAANPVTLPGLESIEIKSGLEGISNPSNVYPTDSSERGGGAQVLYRIQQK
jgi:hypothetical protein